MSCVEKERTRNHIVTQDLSCLTVWVGGGGGVTGVEAHNSLEIKQFRGYVVICVT